MDYTSPSVFSYVPKGSYSVYRKKKWTILRHQCFHMFQKAHIQQVYKKARTNKQNVYYTHILTARAQQHIVDKIDRIYVSVGEQCRLNQMARMQKALIGPCGCERS